MDMDAANSNLPLWEQAMEAIISGTEITDLRTDLFAALFEKSMSTCKPAKGTDALETIHIFVDGYIAGLPPRANLSERLLTEA